MISSTKVLRTSWSSTLRLPKSSFPPRALLADRPIYSKRCTDDLYKWQQGAERDEVADNTFTLHDGPPYANGSLHVGHALNKILKDITCRTQLLLGKKVSYVPGWDCHGLPIELKALQSQNNLDRPGCDAQLEPIAIRNIARELAMKAIEEQKAGFRKWGIMADWENSWKTMDKDFELRQLDVFKKMLEKGLIYRQYKPVYWSPSSRTALAEAELEHNANHVSTAAFIRFPIRQLPNHLEKRLGIRSHNISAVIWTTTPWTLPANLAIAVSPDLNYTIVKSEMHGLLLMASSAPAEVADLCNVKLTSSGLGSFPGSDLVGTTYSHAMFEKDSQIRHIVEAGFVTAEKGSGLVHIAPGHGMDDYKLCQEHGIQPISPVDDLGRFTIDALPHDPDVLSGKDVLSDGGKAVLNYLSKRGMVLGFYRYTHKYPYDWRSKQPVIIRATEQWFADLGEIRDSTVKALDAVRFVPEAGRERLLSFIRNRSEWCISRQRAWGVPIPALYHAETGAALLTPESVSHIVKTVQDRGIDAWWTDDELDPAWTPARIREGAKYRRGKDTMDVWFDSGTSWTHMSKEKHINPDSIADLYLEGSDQHRGWFQSSLLTKIAFQIASKSDHELKAPFKSLITHGFTLDQHGKKMSKSEGNVISPEQIMNGTLLPPVKRKNLKGPARQGHGPIHDGMGPDALRLWVAGCDYTKDVIVSEAVLKAVNGSLSKLRVTFKLLLGLLDTHNSNRSMRFDDVGWINKIALIQLRHLTTAVHRDFANFEYQSAMGAINTYVNADLSAFYIESIKDCMYTSAENSPKRVQNQMVLWEIFKSLSGMLAPVLPLLVTEVCDYLPQQLSFDPTRHAWSTSPLTPGGISGPWIDKQLEADMPILFAMNSAVKSAQELARADKRMGSSLQSFVILQTCKNNAVEAVQLRRLDELEEFLVVSKVEICAAETPNIAPEAWSYGVDYIVNGQRLVAHVYKPDQHKCSRCWSYRVPERVKSVEAICSRCVGVLEGIREGISKDHQTVLDVVSAVHKDVCNQK